MAENQLDSIKKMFLSKIRSYDILDEIASLEEIGKTPGKDAQAHKATYTSLFGLEKAKCEVKRLYDECYDILNSNNYNSIILEGILNDIIERVC